MTALRQRMLEDIGVRNFSAHTQRSYVHYVAAFAVHFGRSPELLGPEDARAYLLHLVDRGCSSSTIDVARCAIRFFECVTLGREWPELLIPLAKRAHRLPVILAHSEVGRLFEAVQYPKYRTLLMTIYATGMRSSEATHLRAADIDSERMLIAVRQGKGRKDRYVMLSPVLLEALRSYWKRERPGEWLFPGSNASMPVSVCALRQVCKRAAVACGLSKRVTPRTLRHSFATHLLEAGANIRIIQQVLGHRSLRTTARYTYVSNEMIGSVPIPLDRIVTGVDPK